MDDDIHGRKDPVIARSGQSLRYLCETIALFVLGLGIAYISSYLAAHLRWPVSRGLVIEGRWIFDSWLDFPVLDCVGMLIGMVAVPLGWEWRNGSRPRELGFAFPSRWVLYVATATVVAVVFTLVTRGAGLFEHPELSLPSAAFFATYFACVSIAEETMFRAFLQRRVWKMCNSPIAVAISTVLFVSWHGTPTSLQEGFLRIVGGVMLGVFYDRSRSVYPCVVLHWLINMGQV